MSGKQFSLTLGCLFAMGLAPLAQCQPANLALSNTAITTGTTTYQATNTITAGPAFTITGSASVIFQSGGYITLTPGFQATSGTGSPTFLPASCLSERSRLPLPRPSQAAQSVPGTPLISAPAVRHCPTPGPWPQGRFLQDSAFHRAA